MTNTLDKIAQAMIDFDTEQGHIGVDAPVWGRYQGLAGVALEEIRKRLAGTACELAIESVLKGES
jgi:hypothetical protein